MSVQDRILATPDRPAPDPADADVEILPVDGPVPGWSTCRWQLLTSGWLLLRETLAARRPGDVGLIVQSRRGHLRCLWVSREELASLLAPDGTPLPRAVTGCHPTRVPLFAVKGEDWHACTVSLALQPRTSDAPPAAPGEQE